MSNQTIENAVQFVNVKPVTETGYTPINATLQLSDLETIATQQEEEKLLNAKDSLSELMKSQNKELEAERKELESLIQDFAKDAAEELAKDTIAALNKSVFVCGEVLEVGHSAVELNEGTPLSLYFVVSIVGKKGRKTFLSTDVTNQKPTKEITDAFKAVKARKEAIAEFKSQLDQVRYALSAPEMDKLRRQIRAQLGRHALASNEKSAPMLKLLDNVVGPSSKMKFLKALPPATK